MIERQVVLKNKTGLHARPASKLVAFAKELPCKVYIEHNGKKAAADSILQLLALGAREGSVLMLSADGPGDKHSVEKLDSFLQILEGRICRKFEHSNGLLRALPWGRPFC